MAVAGSSSDRLFPLLLFLAAAAAPLLLVGVRSAVGDGAATSCPLSGEHHHHDHKHDRDHGHGDCGHYHDHGHGLGRHDQSRARKLPEEMAEEEDLAMEAFGDTRFSDPDHHHRNAHGGLLRDGAPTLGLWMRAMGCSLLVSMASLICLIILPLFFFDGGKPSKLVVDSLAVFGAGAMLGDAFLHQLPHAFGGAHPHMHDNGIGNVHKHHHEGQLHSHSVQDLYVGLSVLAGILVFLLVEKIVRYVEEKGACPQGHSLHHHHYRGHDKKDDNINSGHLDCDVNEKDSDVTLATDCTVSDDGLKNKDNAQETSVRKRLNAASATNDAKDVTAANGSVQENTPSTNLSPNLKSSLVFGYLNLFSDGVHNFTDGMALGSAFLLYGTVGGWSRTLFLLAHELPQEVGDFGILVRSGFTVFKALFFNFLSALVALAGTALALLLGKDPGHSSLIEGFTAGGFIYIAVAGVLPEMNSGNAGVKSSAIQLTSFIMGMAVALCIAFVE